VTSGILGLVDCREKHGLSAVRSRAGLLADQRIFQWIAPLKMMNFGVRDSVTRKKTRPESDSVTRARIAAPRDPAKCQTPRKPRAVAMVTA